jgi:hypothetical protein
LGRSPFGRDVCLVVAAKTAASLLALAVGFRAVSDDDFARVVHAEAWAHAPRLDPTGTSWLPLPFWLTGALFRLVGPSLGAARALAFALGLASALLVLVAARWITGDRRAALAGALLAAVFPWSARLGVATVPELPAAALTLLALASLATPSPDRRLWGAGGLLLATLSRYEPWPVAIIFSFFSLLGVIRLGQSRAAQVKLCLAALIALAGPAAWVAWNHIAHGDSLHFLARVAAYRQALGPGGDGTLLRLLAYPAAMFREEPELVLSPLALGVVARRIRPMWRALVDAARPYLLPAALAALQIAALSIALVRDGAPTHHPERATLVGLLILALAVGDLGARAFRAAATPSDREVTAFGAFVVVLIGLFLVRPFLFREHFNARTDEVAIGRAAAEIVPPGTKVLIEIHDYGYFAILAAFARPADAVLDRSIDPRDPPIPSSFDDPAALRRRASESGAAYFIARPPPSPAPPPGTPMATRGVWALWRIEETAP